MSLVAIVIFTSIVAANDELDQKINGTPEERVKAAMNHRCNKLQEYYQEAGSDIDMKCDKLVSALVDWAKTGRSDLVPNPSTNLILWILV